MNTLNTTQSQALVTQSTSQFLQAFDPNQLETLNDDYVNSAGRYMATLTYAKMYAPSESVDLQWKAAFPGEDMSPSQYLFDIGLHGEFGKVFLDLLKKYEPNQNQILAWEKFSAIAFAIDSITEMIRSTRPSTTGMRCYVAPIPFSLILTQDKEIMTTIGRCRFNYSQQVAQLVRCNVGIHTEPGHAALGLILSLEP